MPGPLLSSFDGDMPVTFAVIVNLAVQLITENLCSQSNIYGNAISFLLLSTEGMLSYSAPVRLVSWLFGILELQ